MKEPISGAIAKLMGQRSLLSALYSECVKWDYFTNCNVEDVTWEDLSATAGLCEYTYPNGFNVSNLDVYCKAKCVLGQIQGGYCVWHGFYHAICQAWEVKNQAFFTYRTLLLRNQIYTLIIAEIEKTKKLAKKSVKKSKKARR